MTNEPLTHQFKLSLFVYSNLMRLLAPILRIKAYTRGQREPGYLHAVGERFAHYDQTSHSAVQRFANGAIWIHAVSLGETKAAHVLVKAIMERGDDLAEEPRFLLTHSTATGRQAGLELIESLGLDEHSALQVWYPWDTPGAVKRFLKQFKPKLGLLMETEVWPNMVLACQNAHIPLVLVNARMNDKSFKSALALGNFARTIYQRLTAVFAQAPSDEERLKALGAPVKASIGNIKFDASVDHEQLRRGKEFAATYYAASQKRIVLFASSREGEEALLFQALIANRTLTEGVQWLIVPRHPQRFDEVKKLGLQFGLTVSKRINPVIDSDAGIYFEQENTSHPLLPQIWMGDTVGEMPLYYAMASAALLGGSFERLGGQNLIEAAACACPVVMGPHVFNFSQAAQQSIQTGAALQTQTLHEACQLACKIALNPSRQTDMSNLALAFASQNRGAVMQTLRLLKSYI